MLLVGLCDCGKTLLFSRVSCSVVAVATLWLDDWMLSRWASVGSCFMSLMLLLLLKLLCIICFLSYFQENSSGHRPRSLIAVLHTESKMTGWVKDWYREDKVHQCVSFDVKLGFWFNIVDFPFCLQGSTWTLIDLPGHDSLRPQYLEKFKSAARWEKKKLLLLVNASFLNFLQDIGLVHDCYTSNDFFSLSCPWTADPLLFILLIYWMCYKNSVPCNAINQM